MVLQEKADASATATASSRQAGLGSTSTGRRAEVAFCRYFDLVDDAFEINTVGTVRTFTSPYVDDLMIRS